MEMNMKLKYIDDIQNNEMIIMSMDEIVVVKYY